jgi:hypothetical protein
MNADLFDFTCGSCEHYIERDGEQQGSCYRYPPTPLPISMQPQSRVVTPEGDAVTPVTGNVAIGAMYPPVNRATLACGEYETSVEEKDTD